jgi:hypothetical protein
MNNLDINKIVDDAMEKKDRQVHIFIVSDTVSVNVTPLADSDPRWIIHETMKAGRRFPVREFECSECHVWVKDPMPYCGFCGEKLRMPIEEDRKEEATDKCKTCKWSHLHPMDECCAGCEDGNRYEEATDDE